MYSISEADIDFIGRDLKRPECVIATRAGEIFASHGDPDGPGGIARLRGNDAPELILGVRGDVPAHFVPNGYSLLPNGEFLIANVGDDGGVFTLSRDGTLKAFLTEIDGRRLPSTNFANRDEMGRIWISVSTWQEPRDLAFRKEVADGFIILVDDRGARSGADDVCFANENKVDPSGRWLYVHETMGRGIVRYEIKTDSSLGPKESVALYGPGMFPDGFEFDSEGGIWVTSVLSNRIVRVAADGSQDLVIDAGDADVIAKGEAAYQAGTYERAHMNAGADSLLGNCASVTFGGPDLKTVYVGSLFGDRIATFRSPVAGAIPPHWTY